MDLIKTPLECLLTIKAAEYRGTQKYTQSYRTCQRWDSQSPHRHAFLHAWMFPEGNLTSSGSYCRNPGGVRAGVWCFTTDPRVAWDYCHVPACGCRMTRTGTEYSGAISRTVSGRTCQRWSTQIPHSHSYFNSYEATNDLVKIPNPDNFVKGAENYCRNPNGQEQHGPWCYTTDPAVRWEYCDVPYCECRQTQAGTEYSGRISHTHSGRVCQRWDQQSPHRHEYINNPARLNGQQLGDDVYNYCRNPDPARVPAGPWCLTTDPQIRWEHCNVPYCSSEQPNVTLKQTLKMDVQQGDHQLTSAFLNPVTEPATTKVGLIAGLSIGVPLLLLIFLFLSVVWIFHRRRNRLIQSPTMKSTNVRLGMMNRNNKIVGNKTNMLTNDFMDSAELETTCPTRVTFLITRTNKELPVIERDICFNGTMKQRRENDERNFLRKSEFIRHTQLRVHSYDSMEFITKPERISAVSACQEEFNMDIKIDSLAYCGDKGDDTGVPV